MAGMTRREAVEVEALWRAGARRAKTWRETMIFGKEMGEVGKVENRNPELTDRHGDQTIYRGPVA